MRVAGWRQASAHEVQMRPSAENPQVDVAVVALMLRASFAGLSATATVTVTVSNEDARRVITGRLRFGLVEPRGFEPLTPTMPLWCSTN